MRPIHSWPLRTRLTAGFSAATLIALIAAGAFIYWRIQYALDRDIDTELGQAAATIGTTITSDGSVRDRDEADATGVAWQVLNTRGEVLDHGGPAGSRPHVTRRWLKASKKYPRAYNAGDLLPASPKPYRLRVSQVDAGPARYVLVAVRRDHRDEALRELLGQLVIAGIAMLAFSSFVGDRLARAALAPVERYRRQAAAIAAGADDLRLDVPRDRDDEVTRLGHTFNEMLASLEQSLERERQFVNEASHELRTPITLLTTRIQLARRRSRSTDQYEQVLDELSVDLHRLAELAEHLLQLSAAAGRRDRRQCDLTAVAQRVREQRHTTTALDDLTIDLPTTPVPAGVADVDAERILGNLVDNALHHGAPPVRVSVDRPDPAWARIVVSDAGAGMPSELLKTATHRFTRADAARSRPGAGLGLALIEALATNAGGEVRLCYDGRHVGQGNRVPIACSHGPAMSVTVLLPTTPAHPSAPGRRA